MTVRDRRAMAERVLDRAVARLRASMKPAEGPFLSGMPCAVMGGREDRQYVTAGRIITGLDRRAGGA